MEERCIQPTPGESFLLTPFISGLSSGTHAQTSREQPASLNILSSCTGGEISNRDVISVMSSDTLEEHNINMETNCIGAAIEKSQGKFNFSQQLWNPKFQQMLDSQGYLQPVDGDSVTNSRTKLTKMAGKETKTSQCKGTVDISSSSIGSEVINPDVTSVMNSESLEERNNNMVTNRNGAAIEKSQRKLYFSQQVENPTFQQMLDSQGYLQPADSDSLTNSRTKLTKMARKETKTSRCKETSLDDPPLPFTSGIEIGCRQSVIPRTPNQSFPVDPKKRTAPRARDYQNERLPDTTYKNAVIQGSTYHSIPIGESQYAHIYCNANWEIPHDHLMLKKKIGGGSFGQVWKGKVSDITGAGERSVVAVKMLKGKIIISVIKCLRAWKT